MCGVCVCQREVVVVCQNGNPGHPVGILVEGNAWMPCLQCGRVDHLPALWLLGCVEGVPQTGR